MSALNAKPSSSLNGIKYISRSILAILELQNVRNAEEKGFAREKINNIFFGTMCSACAERDAHFVRDVCFASDVRFARVAEHITSLCDQREQNITVR